MPTHARVIAVTTEKVCTCAACGEPIMLGDAARRDDTTGVLFHPECVGDSHDEGRDPYRGSNT